MHNARHCLDSERGNLKQFKNIKRIKVGFIDENSIHLNFEHNISIKLTKKVRKVNSQLFVLLFGLEEGASARLVCS